MVVEAALVREADEKMVLDGVDDGTGAATEGRVAAAAAADSNCLGSLEVLVRVRSSLGAAARTEAVEDVQQLILNRLVC